MAEPPDTTTGAPIVNIAPPEPAPDATIPAIGSPPQGDGGEDMALRDTAVQGAEEEE